MNVKKSLVFLLVSVMILVTMGLSIPSAGAVTIPTHVITGYWQNFNNGATCLKISQVPTSYGIIAVAFADATGTPGAVSFTLDSGLSAALGGYTDAQFKADIATVHGRGQKVIISVGGQNGAISVNSSSSATNFANSVHSLMSNYGFDGVDIDLENGVSPTYMAQALNNLAGQNPGLIIAMAPETIYMQSPSSTYLDLCLRVKSILTVVNTQYYNSGSMLGYNGQVYSQGTEDFMTALATIPLENGLAPGQVGLGLPASTSAAGSGYVAPSLVNRALDCLYNGTNPGTYIPPHTYPGIRGAMTWSINWDASNGYNWVNTIYPHLSSLGGGGSTPTPTPTATATPTATPGGSTATPTPTATPGSTATPTPGGLQAWAPNTWYNVNDLVSYGGSTYSCRQAHTSLVGWEPPNVPALWLLQ